MKILIVTCLKEYLKDVARIFKQSNIDVFSTNEITGHRNSATVNLLEDWFASGGEDADSMMIFTFTPAANAEKGLELIKDYNETIHADFPIRAFIMPVERSV
ncbi:MAG: hypothetical protein WC615_04435 [Mucilaginibacter sp.]|jgi:hypothetical protein|uniref:hypothetical protein n=1 Tax=Mucilaginibacter sp. TaxID=1882438 RepID=UPI0035690B95